MTDVRSRKTWTKPDYVEFDTPMEITAYVARLT
jgi:coenzyme PQQ precursor peptide PqqA